MSARILIVDDAPENIEAFRAILESYIRDIEILTAESGPDGLALAAEHLPDVVLLDVHMPGMDGFEACRHLKSKPETQNISVLMVSALMTAGRHRAAGIECGAEGYLCKPFDSAELVAQVRSLIRLKRYEDELRMQQDRLERELRDRTAQLRMSENQWRRLFEEAPDPIFIEDTRGNVIEVNQAACRLHGMTHGELVRKNVQDLVPPSERQRVMELFPKWDPGVMRSFEGFSYTRDGRSVPVEVRATCFEYFGQSAFLFHVRDISERKKMEQELAQTQKLESIGLLAGGIAHDFNNILTGVVGNLSLMKLDVKPEDPLYGLLCDAEASALRAKLLTQQLLTFSKGGAPILKTSSMRHLLETAPRFVLSGSRAMCDNDVPEDLWPVDIDAGQISQVIENIVINASQAMPDGGVIRITAENVLVDPAMRKQCKAIKSDRAVRVVIADEGSGIPAEDLPRIFDPYFSTKTGGSGLGLATSYAIVGKHGGSISVASVPGKGTAFTLCLPASERPIEDTPPSPSAHVQGHGRILVMDDEPAILRILTASLTKLGYRVSTAPDGRSALTLYQDAMRDGDRFDAVILDLTVPGGMGGEEAIRLLRAVDPGVKAIVSSGYSSGLAMSVPELYGFKAAVEKPYSIQILSQVLHAVLTARTEPSGNGTA